MAGFADILKRLKPSKLPKISPKVIEWTLYITLFLVLGIGGTAGTLWYLYQPEIEKLESKDPDRYQEMTVAFKDMELRKAWKLYQILDHMTMEEVYQLRYTKWKTRWNEDKEFREKRLEARSEIHDSTKVTRRDLYATRVRNIEAMRNASESDLREAWKRASPWKKGLMLREGCVRHLETEVEEIQRRQNVDQPATRRRFLTAHEVTGLSPSERCDQMVRVDHQDATVEQALLQLKAGMNYYYFSRLIDELGLSREEMFSLSERAVKMADDFNIF